MLSRRKILRKLAVWLLLIPVTGFAASGDEFYQRLYQRGIAHFAAGEYASAFTEMRNAAFGFVEHVDQFETAQTYAAIAAHRLGHDGDARDSLLRIVGAEKVQPHYRSVKLPDDLRAESDSIAATLLTSQECTLLGVPQQVQDAAKTAKPPVVVPTPGKRPNVAVTAPRGQGAADTPPGTDPGTQPKQTAPPPVAQTPPPAMPQPATPPPQPVVPVTQPPDPVTQPAPPSAEEAKPRLQPSPPASVRQPEGRNADASLAEAQRALDDGEISRARTIYSALLAGPQLTHAATLRLAEGLYRVRD
ncbi:MAG TPA: hypothetical protein VNN08_23295, partial [Thermoanaerobaculia bacterium]|nr:hypothetical protein [Thermoanaerobaculia bacterium]